MIPILATITGFCKTYDIVFEDIGCDSNKIVSSSNFFSNSSIDDLSMLQASNTLLMNKIWTLTDRRCQRIFSAPLWGSPVTLVSCNFRVHSAASKVVFNGGERMIF